MEHSDIYDNNRRRTGKTVAKGEKLTPGEYYLAVHVWIMNNRGQFLIQKRAHTVLKNQDMWSLTSGAAISGEDSYGACVREVLEELGIEPNMDGAKMLFTLNRDNNFCDVWLVRQEICLDECVLQVEEVSDVRWANRKQIFKMIAEGEFVQYSYIKRLFENIYAAYKF